MDLYEGIYYTQGSQPGWTYYYFDKYDDLQRWFYNYMNERSYFCGVYEWITIEKVNGQYHGTIGTDHQESRRFVTFDHTAPPPPLLFLPSREKYKKPEPVKKDPSELGRNRLRRPNDTEWFDAVLEGDRQTLNRMSSYNYYMLRQTFRASRYFEVPVSSEPPKAPPPPRYRKNQ